MDYVLDPPFIHIEEEELVNADDFLPPSFLNGNPHTHSSFSAPSSSHAAPSRGMPSQLHPPVRAKTVPRVFQDSRNRHGEPFVSNPLIPSTSLTRSPSSDTTSTQTSSAATDEEPVTSPIPIVRSADRPRMQGMYRDSRDTHSGRAGFRRIPGATSPDSSSVPKAKPDIVCSPGTLRRINALSNNEFKLATRDYRDGTAKRPTPRGDLAFTKQGKTPQQADSQGKTVDSADGMSASKPSSLRNRVKRVATN